jgi:hypothetical protein
LCKVTSIQGVFVPQEQLSSAPPLLTAKDHLAATCEAIKHLEQSSADILAQNPRILGFWQRWNALHYGFIRKVLVFVPTGQRSEDFIEREMHKLLRLRAAFVSSAVQFFHRHRDKCAAEARLLATLFAGSDRVWIETVDREIRQLRHRLSAMERTRRIIGAYSGKNERGF